MKSVDFLIVGGSAAGTTAAEVIRSNKPDASIIIVTDEDQIEYSRVLLPHYIRHKVNRDQIFLKKPQWYEQKNIVLLKRSRVKSLENSKKIVTLENGEQIKYGKLLIAIGGDVIRMKVPGSDLGNILYFRTVSDADAIIEGAKKSKKAVIIGGGFIGLEFASSFKVNGVGDITMLVREPYYWSFKLDEDSSKALVSVLKKNGIKIVTNEDTEIFEGTDKVRAVVTKSGDRFECDVVGIGIGIRSDLGWLAGSGIKIDKAIVTNEYLETNLPDVYAAGDCAQFHDVIFNREHIMGNWANATSQGSAVGKTMSGERTVFETASFYSINFFDPPTGVAGGSCSFIGVTDSDFADETIARGAVAEGKMTRIFIKTIDGVMRVVGATVINDPKQVAPLTFATKNKTDISKWKGKLGDTGFDLREINS